MTFNQLCGDPFWHRLERYGTRIALIDAATANSVQYAELANSVRIGAKRLSRQSKLLICLAIGSDVNGIQCYLSALAAGHTILLCAPDSDADSMEKIIKHYQPELVICRNFRNIAGVLANEAYKIEPALFGYRTAINAKPNMHISAELGLLMQTSGSTNSPKCVGLSFNNIAANAWQIANGLGLRCGQNTVLALPLHHIYGLSAVNSALLTGGKIIVRPGAVTDRLFWERCKQFESFLAPVTPFQLTLIKSIAPYIALEDSAIDFCSSSGAIDSTLQQWINHVLLQKGHKFFSMYGMTEAAGRISILPSDEFKSRPGSVGRPVAFSEIQIGTDGEIIYTGPNVMLGYSNGRGDLSAMTSLGAKSRLSTGDTGYLDTFGNLYITGRISRTGKIQGIRVNLADIESAVSTVGDLAVICHDDRLLVFYTECDAKTVQDNLRKALASMGLPYWACDFCRLSKLPRTASGKICYEDLRHLNPEISA